MEAFEAVRTLLAVRQYEQGKSVPAELVERIVQSAHLTASSRNGQPWHFVVVQDRDTLRRLGELAHTGPYIAQAAFAIAVAYDKDSPFGLSDTSRAIQDMMLVAWSEGLGSNWVGFAGMLGDVARFLHIPDSVELVAVIPFGYPANNIGRGKKNRKPIGEVVSRERFGQPWA